MCVCVCVCIASGSQCVCVCGVGSIWFKLCVSNPSGSAMGVCVAICSRCCGVRGTHAVHDVCVCVASGFTILCVV